MSERWFILYFCSQLPHIEVEEFTVKFNESYLCLDNIKVWMTMTQGKCDHHVFIYYAYYCTPVF